MPKERELWGFVAERLRGGKQVMLLVVVQSSGSSPGRAGYKMAVASDGRLCGSIGGGAMEVSLVEQAREDSKRQTADVVEQVHRKDAANSSGMICSGRQTVIFRRLDTANLDAVEEVMASLDSRDRRILTITRDRLDVADAELRSPDLQFEVNDNGFAYTECLGPKNDLYIIGGGHCALALSALMSKMDFCISVFDDRPGLNTLEKNRFANKITIIDTYEKIGDLIPSRPNVYVVVMTLGYTSDAVVIRQLARRDFKYFGVLGSKAKMATLIKQLGEEGFDEQLLRRIHTPIGLPINSRTPEEIAVSIAAEIISIKNSRPGS